MQQPDVEGARFPQPLIGGQRHLLVAQAVAHPRHRDRNLLIGQVNRPPLRGPAHVARQPALPHIPLAGESRHVGRQLGVHLLERHRNQRLDQRDARVQVRSRRQRHRHQADVVSFSSNLSYFARHGW